MKKTFAFCGFIFIVLATVTVGGIILLAASYTQWGQSDGEDFQEEIPEEIPQESAVEITSLETVSRIFADEVSDFSALERLGDEENGQFLYRITTSIGEARYVAWGTGVLEVPEGLSEISTGPLATGMERAWAFLDPEEDLLLSSEAFLLR